MWCIRWRLFQIGRLFFRVKGFIRGLIRLALIRIFGLFALLCKWGWSLFRFICCSSGAEIRMSRGLEVLGGMRLFLRGKCFKFRKSLRCCILKFSIGLFGIRIIGLFVRLKLWIYRWECLWFGCLVAVARCFLWGLWHLCNFRIYLIGWEEIIRRISFIGKNLLILGCDWISKVRIGESKSVGLVETLIDLFSKIVLLFYFLKFFGGFEFLVKIVRFKIILFVRIREEILIKLVFLRNF